MQTSPAAAWQAAAACNVLAVNERVEFHRRRHLHVGSVFSGKVDWLYFESLLLQHAGFCIGSVNVPTSERAKEMWCHGGNSETDSFCKQLGLTCFTGKNKCADSAAVVESCLYEFGDFSSFKFAACDEKHLRSADFTGEFQSCWIRCTNSTWHYSTYWQFGQCPIC